jgi:hypothetical protein
MSAGRHGLHEIAGTAKMISNDPFPSSSPESGFRFLTPFFSPWAYEPSQVSLPGRAGRDGLANRPVSTVNLSSFFPNIVTHDLLFHRES